MTAAVEPRGRGLHAWLLSDAPDSRTQARLSRAYLLNAESLEPDDTLRLSEMGAGDSAAPYHLVNVALNLQGSADPGLRGRNADFFVFGKRYCGGPRTGYCCASVPQ